MGWTRLPCSLFLSGDHGDSVQWNNETGGIPVQRSLPALPRGPRWRGAVVHVHARSTEQSTSHLLGSTSWLPSVLMPQKRMQERALQTAPALSMLRPIDPWAGVPRTAPPPTRFQPMERTGFMLTVHCSGWDASCGTSKRGRPTRPPCRAACSFQSGRWTCFLVLSLVSVPRSFPCPTRSANQPASFEPREAPASNAGTQRQRPVRLDQATG